MEVTQLNKWQVFTLTIAFVIGTTFVVLPNALMTMAKQFSWLVVIPSCAYGMLLACGWLYLLKLHPELSLIQIAVRVLGKWCGGLVAILYIFYFLQIASWVTRNMSDFMSITLMPRTPIPIFIFVVLFICAYAVSKGIEPIAMVCQIMIPLIILSFWIPFSIMLREWDWVRFHDQGSQNFHLGHAIFQTKYTFGFPFMETISFLMLLPFVQPKARKSFLFGIGAAGIMFSVSIFFTVGILGVYRGSHLTYPIYIIFREMQLSNFIEHLEAILSVNLLFLVFLKLSILFYCAVLGICQLFHIQNRAMIAFPMVWVISAYSLLFRNITENVEWVQKYLFPYYFLYGVILPSILIGVTWIRSLKNSKKGENTIL